MVIFHSYVKLPEGKQTQDDFCCSFKTNRPTPDLHRAPLTALRLRLQHWRHPQGWERLLCQVGDGPGNTLGMGQVTYGITGISI